MLYILVFLIWVNLMIKNLRYVPYKELYNIVDYSTNLSKREACILFEKWLEKKDLI